jgi:hypothetical protein
MKKDLWVVFMAKDLGTSIQNYKNPRPKPRENQEVIKVLSLLTENVIYFKILS